MKIIRPTQITDAYFTSSNVPETDFAVWSSATTYAAGDKRIKAHRIWQSVQAANLNHDPETSGVSWWVDIGPTNRWAMFDSMVGTVTSQANNITVVLVPGRCDSIALLNCDCAQITVDVSVSGSSVYSHTESMIDSGVIMDWLGYFSDPVTGKTDLVLTDLPVYGSSVVTVTLSKPSGNVSCGVLAVGLQAEIGDTLASPTIGIVDFSSVTRDSFGVPTMIKRSYSRRCSAKLILTRQQVDYVFATLADYRATPMVWIGSDNEYQSLLIYGFYKDFEIDISYPTISYCTLTIEGMT